MNVSICTGPLYIGGAPDPCQYLTDKEGLCFVTP